MLADWDASLGKYEIFLEWSEYLYKLFFEEKSSGLG